ncbi:MAG: lipopolysaccharide transport periplasmic protein LptA [Rhizomicrobium sp.]
MKAALAFAAAILLSAGAQAQQAQQTQTSAQSQPGLGFGKHDSNQPINVDADSFEGDLATKVGTYKGNVIVTQGDMKMRSDNVRIVETGDKPSKVFAHGAIVIDAPNGTATGDDGVYDLNLKTITLTGKVVLTKEKNVMRGTRLVMDMNTNIAHLTAAGMKGNRVQAVLNPNQKTSSGGGAKTTKPGGGK